MSTTPTNSPASGPDEMLLRVLRKPVTRVNSDVAVLCEYAVRAAERIEQLTGERALLCEVLRECDQVISTLEPECSHEDEGLRQLLRSIKRLTLLRQADERDLLTTGATNDQ